ncbi:tetratricopeptide repeat protein [Oscillospiraceae bacterium 50-58]
MKKFVMLCVVCSLLLSLCACGQSTSGQADSAEQLTWQEQYDLGLRYLEDGNYEEAIIAFTAAIEIDPKRAENYVARGDAYVGYAQTLAEGGTLSGDALEAYENAAKDYRTAIRRDKTDVSVYRKAAEVYIILGDTDSARDVIEKGLRNTEDESLRDLLDELTGVVAAEDLTEGSAEWQALEAFLWRFNECYGDYDCETATVPDSFSSLNALEKMLVGTDGSCYCYNDKLYPGERMEWYPPFDPNLMERLGPDGPDRRVNAARLDWILEHIFNCSPEDIASMKEPIVAGQSESIYYLDGYYYFWVGGLGDPFIDISITKIEPVGMRYYVEYYFYDISDDTHPPESFHSAMVSLKEIDGEKYWSLYYNRYNQVTDGGGTPPASNPPEENYTSNPSIEAYFGEWAGIGVDVELHIEGLDADRVSGWVTFPRITGFGFIGTVDLNGRIALYDETDGMYYGELVLVGDQITMTLNDSFADLSGGTQYVFH